MERGPLRASLWVRLEGGKSRLDFTINLSQDRPVVDISVRVMWDERSARLKLVMPNVGEQAEYDVPGGTVMRDPAGEVPGGRWVRTRSDTDTFGFATNALYNFDQHGDDLRVTVCRATRYANDVETRPEEIPWRPAVDVGELRFNAIITPGDDALPKFAEQLEQPPETLLVPAKKGTLPRVGSLMSLSPANLKLLALKPASNGPGLILRVQETAGKSGMPKLTLHGKRIALSRVKPYTIATWRLIKNRAGWRATETNIAEE
jgi:alpha-mannosidase